MRQGLLIDAFQLLFLSMNCGYYIHDLESHIGMFYLFVRTVCHYFRKVYDRSLDISLILGSNTVFQ